MHVDSVRAILVLFCPVYILTIVMYIYHCSLKLYIYIVLQQSCMILAGINWNWIELNWIELNCKSSDKLVFHFRIKIAATSLMKQLFLPTNLQISLSTFKVSYASQSVWYGLVQQGRTGVGDDRQSYGDERLLLAAGITWGRGRVCQLNGCFIS